MATKNAQQTEVKELKELTFPVKGFKHITRNVEKPLIVFEVDGYDKGVARSETEFLIDLQNSGIITNPNAQVGGQEFNAAIAKFKQGRFRKWTLNALMRYNEVGDTIALQADHPLVVSGKRKAGYKQTIKSDGFWVEGFVSFMPNEQELDRMDEAELYVSRRLEMEMFAKYGSATPAQDTPKAEPSNSATNAAIGSDDGNDDETE